MLDVIQNIRKLLTNTNEVSLPLNNPSIIPTAPSRNYRVKKDFDSLEKLEFIEKTFQEVKEYLKRYIGEILQLDNVKARTILDGTNAMECILVNRNKIATEAHLTLAISSEGGMFNTPRTSEKQIIYSINENTRNYNKAFSLVFDDYELFWMNIGNSFFANTEQKKLFAKEIADIIWEECLNSIGIV